MGSRAHKISKEDCQLTNCRDEFAFECISLSKLNAWFHSYQLVRNGSITGLTDTPVDGLMELPTEGLMDRHF